jgi:hypothetical protein
MAADRHPLAGAELMSIIDEVGALASRVDIDAEAWKLTAPEGELPLAGRRGLDDGLGEAEHLMTLTMAKKLTKNSP